MDAEKYPARELIALYHERWELEIGYDEVKTHLLLREEAIRSQTPDNVCQEIWGILLAYNMVRLEIVRVAAEAEVAPTRISFLMSVRRIRTEWEWLAIASGKGGAATGQAPAKADAK